MKIDYDVSQLTWQALTDDEQLAAATEALQQIEQMALKVVAMPTSRGATKTIQHLFAKDRLNPRRKNPKTVHEHIRGGRFWRHRPLGSALKKIQCGDVCVIPKDFGTIRALGSIRNFVEVAPA